MNAKCLEAVIANTDFCSQTKKVSWLQKPLKALYTRLHK